MKTKTIKISDIVIDAGTQQRVAPTDSVIDEYCEAIKCGSKFPVITVFSNGVEYYLVDGFHRYFAYKKAGGINEIEADIHEGTKRDALLYSAGVNGTHGLRLTNADKRKAVLVLVNDDEWTQWSNRQLAKHCHVSDVFVGNLRKKLESNESQVANVCISALEPALNRDDDQKLSTGNESNNDNFDSDQPEINESELMAEIAEEIDLTEELQASNKEIDRLNKVIESDDQLATAMAENKRLTELCRVLEERMRGYQSSENEAVRKARMWKEKYDKLQRQVKSAGLVDF